MKTLFKAFLLALSLSSVFSVENSLENQNGRELSLDDMHVSEQMVAKVYEKESVHEDILADIDAEVARELQETNLRRNLAWTEGNPQAIWMMSFPESGAHHVMDIIQKSSGMATATNYGHIILREDGKFQRSDHNEHIYQNGPVWYNNDMERPTKYVATRTHGTGYCLFCHPKEYYFGNFWWKSASGLRMLNGKREALQYNPSDVKRMIHLIRDPYDNVVARFYSYIGLMNANRPDLEIETKFPLNEDGFKAWCKFQDDGFESADMKWLPVELRALAKEVPCRQEFVKYARFHSNVFLMARFRKIRFMMLRYEDYVKDQTGTIQRVNNFLEIPVNNTEIPQTIVGDGIWNFRDFYTDEERVSIERLMRNLSQPPIWFHLSFYTPDFYTDAVHDDPDFHRINEDQ